MTKALPRVMTYAEAEAQMHAAQKNAPASGLHHTVYRVSEDQRMPFPYSVQRVVWKKNIVWLIEYKDLKSEKGWVSHETLPCVEETEEEIFKKARAKRDALEKQYTQQVPGKYLFRVVRQETESKITEEVAVNG